MTTNYWEIGYQHFNAGRYDLAIANLEQVRPIGVDLLQTIGLAYLKKGEPYLAIQKFDHALRIEPNEWTIWYNRGLAHLQTVIRPQRVQRTESYVDIRDGTGGTRYRSYWVFEPNHVDQRYYQAIDDFSNAITIRSDEYLPWHDRGLALISLAQDMTVLGQLRWDVLNQAMSDCNRAIKIDQLNSNIWNNRGLVFWLMGDTKKATQDFKHALSIDRGNVLAKGNLRRLKSDVRGKRILGVLAFLIIGAIVAFFGSAFIAALLDS